MNVFKIQLVRDLELLKKIPYQGTTSFSPPAKPSNSINGVRFQTSFHLLS